MAENAEYVGVALVVCVSIYEILPNLPNSRKDAEAMAHNFARCRYKVFSCLDGSKKDLVAKRNEFCEYIGEHQSQRVFFFYAGHGITHGINHYMLFKEYASDDKNCSFSENFNGHLYKYSYEVEKLIKEIRKYEVNDGAERAIVIFLDCCRKKPLIYRDSEPSGVNMIQKNEPGKIGVLICYACGEDKAAIEGRKNDHGVYTKQLLQHLFVPNAKLFDQIIEANKKVSANTNQLQTPEMKIIDSDLFGFCLCTEKIEEYKDFSQKDEDDSIAMEELYFEMNGSFWKKGKGTIKWSLNDFTPKHFYYLKDRLIYLNLQGNNLQGSIPKVIGCLAKLTNLNLSKNEIEGKLPDEIWNLVELEQLNLSDNRIEGKISAKIGQLTELKFLCLSRNRFKGKEQIVFFFTKCVESFSKGDFPSELQNLTKLVEVLLSENQFEGPIIKSLSMYFENLENYRSFFPEDDSHIAGFLLAKNGPDVLEEVGFDGKFRRASKGDVERNEGLLRGDMVALFHALGRERRFVAEIEGEALTCVMSKSGAVQISFGGKEEGTCSFVLYAAFTYEDLNEARVKWMDSAV